MQQEKLMIDFENKRIVGKTTKLNFKKQIEQIKELIK